MGPEPLLDPVECCPCRVDRGPAFADRREYRLLPPHVKERDLLPRKACLSEVLHRRRTPDGNWEISDGGPSAEFFVGESYYARNLSGEGGRLNDPPDLRSSLLQICEVVHVYPGEDSLDLLLESV